MPDQERSRAVALRRHEIDPGVSRPRLRGEIDEHDDGEIEPFAAVDREQADGVVVLREDDALRLVRLVGDAAIEPPRERRERAAALPGDGDEAVDVGEPRLRAREGGEHAIEIEARDEGSQRFAGRRSERRPAKRRERVAERGEAAGLVRRQQSGALRERAARDAGDPPPRLGERRERRVRERDDRAAEHRREGEAIARLHDEADERGHVAHLGRVVEGAAGDDVRDAEPLQRDGDERQGVSPPRQHRVRARGAPCAGAIAGHPRGGDERFAEGALGLPREGVRVLGHHAVVLDHDDVAAPCPAFGARDHAAGGAVRILDDLGHIVPARGRAPAGGGFAPSGCGVGPSGCGVGPSAGTVGLSACTVGPSAGTVGLSACTVGPSACRVGLSACTVGPSACRVGLSAGTVGPSACTVGPSARRVGPSARRVGPSGGGHKGERDGDQVLGRAVFDLEIAGALAGRAALGEVAGGERVDEAEDGSARAAALREGHEIGVGRARGAAAWQAERVRGSVAAELRADAGEDGDVGAAEPVDGLLAVADEEQAVALQVRGRRHVARAARPARVVALAQQVHEIALHGARVLELVDEEDVHVGAHHLGEIGPIAQPVARRAQDVPEAERPCPSTPRARGAARVLEQVDDPSLAGLELRRVPEERGDALRVRAKRAVAEALSELVELLVHGLLLPPHRRREQLDERAHCRLRQHRPRRPPRARRNAVATPEHPVATPEHPVATAQRAVGGERGAARQHVEEGARRALEALHAVHGDAARDALDPREEVARAGDVIRENERAGLHALLVEPIEETRELHPERTDPARRGEERARRRGRLAVRRERAAQHLVDRERPEVGSLVLVEDPHPRREPEREPVPIHDAAREAMQRVDAGGRPPRERVRGALLQGRDGRRIVQDREARADLRRERRALGRRIAR